MNCWKKLLQEEKVVELLEKSPWLSESISVRRTPKGIPGDIFRGTHGGLRGEISGRIPKRIAERTSRGNS